MIWRDEQKTVDLLLQKLLNLGSDIERQLTQFESRKTTLGNEIARLDADYAVLLSRNDQAKKDFQKSQRLDLEKLQEDQRRVKARELGLIEKEKEIHRMKAELETEIAQAKTAKNTIESLGRNHGRK